ncbi:MAG: nitroreductase family protein [Planctomycetota bacterium]|nr:nitroreductase family protein [Planctomycetota bacterium]
MDEPVFVPLPPRYVPDAAPEVAAREFCERMETRRSIRMFSDRPVSRETIEWIVRAAGSAPSGANKQPWRFVCVSDPAAKSRIRAAAEKEEREFYRRRASERWLQDLAPLGTDDVKEYLEVAPWLIVIFKLAKDEDGAQVYYAAESVGIATGMLLTAAHLAGLCTLTHTPSPMGFLGELLGRSPNERAYMVVPIGYPADDCAIPEEALNKKPLDEIMTVHESA